jgi:hypothetical protein
VGEGREVSRDIPKAPLLGLVQDGEVGHVGEDWPSEIRTIRRVWAVAAEGRYETPGPNGVKAAVRERRMQSVARLGWTYWKEKAGSNERGRLGTCASWGASRSIESPFDAWNRASGRGTS